MIPMGSVVTACMFAGLIVAVPPMAKVCPRPIRLSIGVILLAAGLWNILWYASQHFTEFWGLAAFGSGVFMVLTSIYIIKASGLVNIPNNNSWFSVNRSDLLEPGDTIVVPLNTDHVDNLTLWSTATQILYQMGIAVAAVGSL